MNMRLKEGFLISDYNRLFESDFLEENKKAVKFLPYWRRLLLSICFSNISFFSIILVRVIWGGRYFRRILLNGEYKQVYRK